MNNKIARQLSIVQELEKRLLSINNGLDSMLDKKANIDNDVNNLRDSINKTKDILQKEYVTLGELLRDEK